jgi:hypothetical protein
MLKANCILHSFVGLRRAYRSRLTGGFYQAPTDNGDASV